jgi:transposase-like protein
MKELKQETELKLSKAQLQNVINDHLGNENGLNEMFAMLINGLMFSERQIFLGDDKTEGNKGNGYRKANRSGIGSRLQIKIPRDRMGVFRPVILGLLDEQEEQIKDLCFELYGKGLTTRQIEDVIAKIYGSSYSKSSVSRITTDFSALVESWLNRPLEHYYPVVYIDAIHIKVRRETVATEAFYILLGFKEDHTREVLGIINIPQESASGWQEVLESIRSRGVQRVGLFVFDDLTGLDTVIGKVFAASMQQKCILHFQRNLNKHIRKTDRISFCTDLKEVFNPDDVFYTSEQAVTNLRSILQKWSKTYPKLNSTINRTDLETVFTYLNFDYRIRRMIYTTNWIERLNKSFRRTLKMRNALPNPKAVITLLGFVAIEMQEGTYSYPISNFKFDQNFNYN